MSPFSIINFFFSLFFTQIFNKKTTHHHIMNRIIISNGSYRIKSIKPLLVILTIPHNICIKPPPPHNCDHIALSSAQRLKDYISKKAIDTYILYGDINRTLIDLNRKESKKSSFHKKLDKTIQNLSKSHQLILLDLHSGSFEKDISLIILKQVKFESLNLLNIIQNYTNAIIMLGVDHI